MTQEEALTLFEYREGRLYHTGAYKHNRIKAGQEAGCDADHSRRVNYKGRSYGTHQLVYLMHHGYIPDLIDHKDRNPWNNRVENLRPIDRSGNAFNCDRSENAKGVSYKKDKRKWKAYAQVGGKQKHLGYFTHKEEAEAARAAYLNHNH